MPLSLCTPGCYWNRNHQKWNEMAGGDNMISLEKDRSNRKNFMELSMCMSAIVCVALVHGEQGWNIGWSVRSAPCRPALMSEWLTGPAAPDGNCQRYSGWLLLLTRLFHPSWALSQTEICGNASVRNSHHSIGKRDVNGIECLSIYWCEKGHNNTWQFISPTICNTFLFKYCAAQCSQWSGNYVQFFRESGN